MPIFATWNVGQGGFPSYQPTDRWPERYAAIQHAIRNLRPDVTGLTDTLGWAGMFPPPQLADSFGCQFALAADLECELQTDDAPLGLTLLARGEAARHMRAKVLRLGGRNVIRATFRLAGVLHVAYVAYLHHLYLKARLSQAQAIIVDADTSFPPGTPILVLGDFNALDQPPLPLRLARPILSLPPFSFARHNVLARARGLASREVMQLFYRAGWSNARPPGHADPTHVVGRHPFQVPFTVDHLLVRHWPRPLTNFQTLWYPKASDHALVAVQG